MSHHTFERIAPHTCWLSPDSATDRPVLGVIHGTRGTLVVDAGNSAAHAQLLLREIAQAGIAPPTFVVLTHWHWDHVFGTSTLELPTFSHIETQRIVGEMAQQDWSDEALDRRVDIGAELAFCRDMIKAELPARSELVIRPPEIAFTGQVTVDLGGVTCQLVHVGGDHAPDSTIVYIPEDRIVFLGDCISPDIYHVPHRYTTARLLPLLDRLLAFDATCYLAGHNPEPMSRAAMTEEVLLLKTTARLVAEHALDRTAATRALQSAMSGLSAEEAVELVELFQAGQGIPTA